MESTLVLNERVVDPDNPTDPRQYDHYLAGPMSGYPEFNYPTFTSTTIMLRQSGFVVYSPHEVPWPTAEATLNDQEALWKYMMRQTRKMQRRCNSIILMAGWASSRGAKIELQRAMSMDHQIFTLAYDRLFGWGKDYLNNA
jgi:hypothetical protein